MTVEAKIKQQIADNALLLYMKGTPHFPQCGFSSQVAHILAECGAHFVYVNILAEPEIRATLPKVANWPTFPQLYLKGELIGGCDIVTEQFENGALKTMLEGAGVTGDETVSEAAE